MPTLGRVLAKKLCVSSGVFADERRRRRAAGPYPTAIIPARCASGVAVRTTARRYAQRLDLIAALAREIVDVDDGLPVVSVVTRPAFEHSGARARSLPHLLLHFRDNICSSAVTSARLGRIEALRPDNIRPGNHVAGGFACALGPSPELAIAQVRTMKDFASLAAKVLCVREPNMAGGNISLARHR